MDTSDHGLSHPRKAPGRLRMVWQAKCVGEVSFHFQFGRGTLGIFMFPRTEIWRIEVQHVIGLYLENCRHLLIWLDLFCCGELVSEICLCLLDTLCICLYFGMRDLNMLACVASTGQPSVAVECLESRRVHVRGWRPAFGWGLSLSPRRVCPYCSGAAAFFILSTVGHSYNVSYGQRASE